MLKRVSVLDTTLRDGAQMEGISFSVDDKLRIVAKLDELGVAYIEGDGRAPTPRTQSSLHGRGFSHCVTPASRPLAVPVG